MKHPTLSPRHHEVLVYLTHMPKKMLAIHGADNTAEFVLHELCNPRCFNLAKAAYFIDNADFDCFKGVAGFDQNNHYANSDHWQTPEKFTDHMRSCNFNQKVRSTLQPRSRVSLDKLVNNVAHDLAIQKPESLSWGLKHDNKGVLIFQRNEEANGIDQYLLESLHLLGFCPVF